MLAELTTLLGEMPTVATKEDYRRAIIDDNVLYKKSAATRRQTAQRLSELYALDPRVPIFAALRRLWDEGPEGRPLLACLCANARDPLLRLTSGAVLPVCEGSTVTKFSLEAAVAEATAGRFNPAVLHKIARNAASSWVQSGHLRGRLTKVRARAVATPAGVAFALLLGYLAGERGSLLLDTYWTRLLDAPASTVDALTFEASRRGWIAYRRIGTVVELRFSGLLGAAMETVNGQD